MLMLATRAAHTADASGGRETARGGSGREPRAHRHPRHRHRRRAGARPRRPHPLRQPQRAGAVRLWTPASSPGFCSPTCSRRKASARARLSRRHRARPRPRRAQRRPRGDRPRAAGRPGAAVHDHRAHRRRREILRRAARHHALEAHRGGADQRAPRGGEGLHRQVGFPRQDQPRDPHAAQRHHRLFRGDDGGALRRRSATSATGNTSRTSTPPARIWSRCSTTCSTCPRSRPASSTSPSSASTSTT